MFAVTAGYHRYFSHRAYKTVARVPVPARVLALSRRRRACCGGRATTAITTSTPTAAGRALAGAARLLVLARRLDPRASERARPTYSRSTTSRSTPSCVFLNQLGIQLLPPICWPSLCAARRLARRWSGVLRVAPCCSGTARSPSTRWRTCSATAATTPATTAATTGCSRSSPWARAGTTTTTTIRARAAGLLWWEIDISYYLLRGLQRSAWSGTSASRRRPTSYAHVAEPTGTVVPGVLREYSLANIRRGRNRP